MRSPRTFLTFLAPLATMVWAGLDIDVKVNSGPSVIPPTKCEEHEAVERNDIVVVHFNASYHEDSPSGTAGEWITGSLEHSEDGNPLTIPVGDQNHHEGWELALIGLCELDHVTLRVAPQYIHGEMFAGKNVPEDAIVKMDVHIVDILVDATDTDSSEDISESLSLSDSEDEELEDEQEEEEL